MDAASILTFSDAKGPYVLGSGIGKSIKDLVQIVFHILILIGKNTSSLTIVC